jgi:hypothetical protein
MLIAALTSGARPVLAHPLDRIVSTGPSWDRFTHRDGTGLYHEILAAVFTPLGIRVDHHYTNANRGIRMVKKGLADMYTCSVDIRGFTGLVLAQHPMYQGRFHALYKKDQITKWQGPATLAGKRVVWRRGYYSPHEFDITFDILETDYGTAALAQVILGRADFYIDDLNLIRNSISATTFTFDKNDYDIRPVGSRTYHPVFKDSPRGRQILDMFDKGIEALHRSGRLKKIFDKWQHPYPEYDLPTR